MRHSTHKSHGRETRSWTGRFQASDTVVVTFVDSLFLNSTYIFQNKPPTVTMTTASLPPGLTASSTPDQIASHLLLNIGAIVDGIATSDSSFYPNGHWKNVEDLYRETISSIQHVSISRQTVVGIMNCAFKLLESMLMDQMNEMKKDITDEIKVARFPAIKADIDVLERQLAEVKSLLEENPKLLEDSIVTEVQRIERYYPVFGCRRLTIRFPDKVVVIQKAVKSQIYLRHCEYQNVIRNKILELHSFDLQIEEAFDGRHCHYENPRVVLFSRKCHYMKSSLERLRELHRRKYYN